MKFSVLISNYNYGSFVIEAVESVLGQTYPASEIIVVDDGSTDDSVARLRKNFGHRPEVKIIEQRNQGQVMAFVTALEVATGDILCLLDADDLYKENYLEVLNEHYLTHPEVDLTFCAIDSDGPPAFNRNLVWLQPTRDYDYGFTALIAYFGDLVWLGNVTTTLSLRPRLARVAQLREAAEKIYIQRGVDDVLLFAASLLGARKYYLHQPLVKYRYHGNNISLHRLSRPEAAFAYQVIGLSWITHYRERCGIRDNMYAHLEKELELVPDPLPEHVAFYRNVIANEVARRAPAPQPPPTRPGTLRRLERGFRNWRKSVFS
jgi:glycosyltransferase involved in cell wall biosynthesis